MLSLKLILDIVTEGTKLQAFIGALVINLFVKLVLLIIKLLQYVFFTVNTSLYLVIESTLLILQIRTHHQNRFIAFHNTVLDLLVDAVFNSVHAILGNLEFISVVFTHLSDLFFEVLF